MVWEADWEKDPGYQAGMCPGCLGTGEPAGPGACWCCDEAAEMAAQEAAAAAEESGE